MGYIWAIGDCFRCHQTFSFNPDKVPSIRINGIREPICEDCIIQVNPLRKARGLAEIVPLPGAYEPGPEYGDDHEPET